MEHGQLPIECKGDGTGRLPSISTHSVHTAMTPPPSYHSFEEHYTGHGQHPRPSNSRERHHEFAYEETPSRRREPSNQEPTTIARSRERENRPQHHRRRCSASPNNGTWTARLVFQGLRSTLLGSSSEEQTNRGATEKSLRWPTIRLDINMIKRDVHHTVHNHWHTSSPPGHTARTTTLPDCKGMGQAVHPLANCTSGALHISNHEYWPESSLLASQRRHPNGQHSFDKFLSGHEDPGPVDLTTEALLDSILATPRHVTDGGHWSTSHPFWGSHWESEPWLFDDGIDRWRKHAPHSSGHFIPIWETPFQRGRSDLGEEDDHLHHERDARSQDRARPGAAKHGILSSSSEQAMLQAIRALAAYNKRWEYIDTVQQPYARELPWPAIRPALSFDHMKCDVFSFFAKGCGLQPDRSKAPKLDFKLSPRSPYPSYDKRQQEVERKALKQFKQQMQREKLRWHEDKLRRKFAGVIGSEDERRKAVWAAIAESSAVCDKKLKDML